MLGGTHANGTPAHNGQMDLNKKWTSKPQSRHFKGSKQPRIKILHDPKQNYNFFSHFPPRFEPLNYHQPLHCPKI